MTTYKTHDDLMVELTKSEGFQREYFRQKPYYDISLQLIKLRAEKEITQVELANLAETHQSRISKIEAAELDIKISTLIKLAEALDAFVDIQLVKQHEDSLYTNLFTVSYEKYQPVEAPHFNSHFSNIAVEAS